MNERNTRDARLANRADWQLPTGVPKGNWDYSETESIALEYDEYFRDHALLAFDAELLEQWFTRPGVVVDFGCGTGRALEKLLERGMTAIGIDLSQPMLNFAKKQLSRFSEEFTAVRANLVDLRCMADETADYSLCLFSTLGMIQGTRQSTSGVRPYATNPKTGWSARFACTQLLVQPVRSRRAMVADSIVAFESARQQSWRQDI